ncbi:MAG: preprotein translocase subunit SecB [Pseudomonadota bacterium]
MRDLIQQAIKSLEIQDVSLLTSRAFLAKGFEPKYDSEVPELVIQFKHIVSRSHVMDLESDQGDERFFRVVIELGARWVKEQESGDVDVKAIIEAEMMAEYLLKQDPGPDALKAFALKNASVHVWPYWREFLSSHCTRMNLPKVTIPAVQFAMNHDAQTIPPETDD